MSNQNPYPFVYKIQLKKRVSYRACAKVKVNGKRKTVHICYRDTPEQAHDAVIEYQQRIKKGAK
jgi:hypothetical protein